ncbi:hypothetical protein BJY04DRAFT_206408 [Aspergillus karnatakaensis]|uniref:uncharacterized protein n=1 Tax=Aspergillus karnatakaensis TaxID=1810916 RepID=UPI003CCDE3AB
MAMGQEQRAIHPFFRKASIPSPSANQPLHISEYPEPNGSTSQTTAVAALDHDPNADRRKRRKISNDPTEPLENVPEFSHNKPNNGDSDDLALAQSSATGAKTPETSEVGFSVQVPAPVKEEEQSHTHLVKDVKPTHDGPTPTGDQEKKQKVIKLNSNGKLLSSPVADRFADKSDKRRSKRVKPAPQPTEREKKLVVIKYLDKGGLQGLAQQVEAILTGMKRYTPPPPVVLPPVTIVPAPTHKQPPKNTHPFFMKKAAPRPDVAPAQAPSQPPVLNVTGDKSTSGAEPLQSRPAPKPLLSFKHAFSKVPEPIHPLWPPAGLSHVRSVQDMLEADDDDFTPIDIGSRKAKTPAIQVNDEENILSCLSESANAPTQVLRTPEKQVISGRVLQAEMSKRLSVRRADASKDTVQSHGLHPAVAKLYASLPTSMTAFDLGGYETQTWAHKYAPTTAQQVLCPTKEALMLRDWLKHLIVSGVETANQPKDDQTKRKDEKKRKRRKKTDKLDGFVVSSNDEASEMGEISGSDDELAGDVTVSTKRTVIRTGDLTLSVKSGTERNRMTNVILVSGPAGCGKTASVYAVAKEMDFEVFEINAGNRRSAKDILDRIGDMTQNHLVNVHANEPASNSVADQPLEALEDAKQNKLGGFFKSAPAGGSKKPGRPKTKSSAKEVDQKRTRSQKQSLILLEEADILFEEDKQFWSGVLTLINQSKRPIVITCNDESRIPLEDISFHAILRYRAPPLDLAVDYLLLVAANEGHVLKRTPVEKLYLGSGSDFRKAIVELNYWCQMAVGSDKSGLDWIIDRWPQGIDLDTNGDKVRVCSMDTYQDYMGWFSRDISTGTGSSTEAELRKEAMHWWQLSLQDAESMTETQQHSSLELGPEPTKFQTLERLRTQSEYMESRSVLDVLATCSLDPRNDAIDTSIPPMPEKQKLNYVEGYQLLHADPITDYTSSTLEIGCTFQTLLGQAYQRIETNSETMLATMTLKTSHRSNIIHPPGIDLSGALVPAMKLDCTAPLSTGHAQFCSERGLRSIAEDYTPYIRGIVAFDLRLEQYRSELSRLLSGSERGTKRVRTTRASRAALEGGNKAETRKERWFSPAVNVARVLATGKREWQDLLVQSGYFTVPLARELTREDSESPLQPVSSRSSSMSLFGTSPDDSSVADSARRSKSSLFADEPSFGAGSANFGGSSLFADDDGLSSPWSTNGVKRTSKQQLVKTLLPDSDVPESYIDVYDLVLSAGERAGSGVGLTSVRELLSGSGLTATDQAKILNLVLSGDTDRSNGLSRGEFSVLLALIGLAQEGEDLTFDTVDDRRKKLPTPRSSYLDGLRERQDSAMSAPSHERPTTPPAPPAPIQEPSSVQSRPSRGGSIGGLDADPWGSPQLHRGHAHAQNEPEHGTLNGYGTVRSGTNAWSKTSDAGNPTEPSGPSRANGRPEAHTSNSAEFGWGDSFGQTPDGSGLGGPVRSGLGDFGRSGSDQSDSNPPRRSLNIDRAISNSIKEVVTVTLLQEKEGMFMFQHRNYEVKSARRGSTVVRRYSDFVWLLDCLHKRYPFRQLPLLPPKRISVNGTHLSADSTSFLEKRRRGLVRFTNSLVQHPVLSQEQLVVMFLTVPTELSVWRKQATISVQDEFSGRVLPPDLEDSLPSTLQDTFDTVRSGVKRSAEVYINLCTLLERLAKRNEGLAADHLRFSLALQSLTEMTKDTYAIDTNDVPLLNEGIKATARHLSASQSLLEDEARAWEDGMLEDLKRQRDNLVSVREMFDRKDRLARNNIPQLERRIETNERKLQDLRAKPQGTVKPGEIEKVEESIFKDKESIVQQHARGVFIKECIRDELTYFQQSQYHISRLHQDWSQERVKYSELQADNWRSLGDQVEGMPLGE